LSELTFLGFCVHWTKSCCEQKIITGMEQILFSHYRIIPGDPSFHFLVFQISPITITAQK